MAILTIAEVAARLGVSRETVRRRIVDGELSYISIGGGKRETRRNMHKKHPFTIGLVPFWCR